MKQYDYKTITYKTIGGSQPVLLDVYFPSLSPTEEVIALPVIVNFHAGGLCVGNRRNMLPTWLVDRLLPLGYAFVSADYRLLVPGTGQEIIEDLQDVFKFIANTNIQGKDYTFKLDGDRIGVCGSSGGGLCAYLCAMHCLPKPKVVLSIYSMGGDFFTGQTLDIKPGEITAVGQKVPQIDSSLVANLTYPYTHGSLKAVTDASFDDGEIQEAQIPRMSLFYFLLQRGVYLDYYTGLHNPSISEKLRTIVKDGKSTPEDLKNALPKDIHGLFPQLSVDSQWPPTVILHGVMDDIVPLGESHNISSLINQAGVLVQLIEVQDENHGFDISPEAEQKHGIVFDRVKYFIKERL